jgi:F420-non-reducing hydrogenase iron-sulfur subunit
MKDLDQVRLHPGSFPCGKNDRGNPFQSLTFSKKCPSPEGNFKAQRRILLLKKVLEEFGIEPERLRLEWVSASEGDKFATIIKDMTEQIRKLGPNQIKI